MVPAHSRGDDLKLRQLYRYILIKRVFPFNAEANGDCSRVTHGPQVNNSVDTYSNGPSNHRLKEDCQVGRAQSAAENRVRVPLPTLSNDEKRVSGVLQQSDLQTRPLLTRNRTQSRCRRFLPSEKSKWR